MQSTAKKQAPRPAKPIGRYWKGKAPKGVVDVESDSETEETPVQQHEENDIPIGGVQEFVGEEDEGYDGGMAFRKMESVPRRDGKAISMSLKDVSISKVVASKEESDRTTVEQEEEEEESSESSEYESEEEQPKVQFRPVFVPKRGRVTITERDALAQDSEATLKRKETKAEERRKQSHYLVGESIKQELAEKEQDELVPDVDDTDGLDPDAEFESWRLRELARIKRDKEDELRREQEREEVERRRALPEEQRLKEDLERAQKSRDEKPKGQQKFLQKYWHKGAFHQDEEILKRHNYTEATESTVDMSLLPKVMQVKNFGKRSRTKYTHLLDQDTTVGTGGFGGTAPVQAGGSSLEGGGCFLCGGSHLKKDCPQNTGPLSNRASTVTHAKSPRTQPATEAGRDREEALSHHVNGGRARNIKEDKSRPYERHSDDRYERHTYHDKYDSRYDDDRQSSGRMPRSRSRSRSLHRERVDPKSDGRRGYFRERQMESDYGGKRRRIE